MRCVLACVLVLAVLLFAGCGASRRAACPATHGYAVHDPLLGDGLTLGGPRVELDLNGQRGNLRQGQTILGPAGIPGWFALKTIFETPSSFSGGFRVSVRRLDRAGVVGLGGVNPPGGTFTAPAGPALNEADGWRAFPVSTTWVRSAGCIEYDVTGHGFTEKIVVNTLKPSRLR